MTVWHIYTSCTLDAGDPFKTFHKGGVSLLKCGGWIIKIIRQGGLEYKKDHLIHLQLYARIYTQK